MAADLRIINRHGPPRCHRCKRILVDEESVARGYGPTCFKKSPGQIQKELERLGQVRLEGV